MRKLQFLRTTVGVTDLVLIVASGMRWLTLRWCSSSADTKHQVRADSTHRRGGWVFSPRNRHLFANPPVTSHGGKPQRTRAPRLDHSSPVFSATGMHAPLSVGDTAQSKVFSSRGGAWGPASSTRLVRHLANPRGVAPSKAKRGGLGPCLPVPGWRPRRGEGDRTEQLQTP